MKVLMMSEIEWGSENDRSNIADFRNMVDDLELRDLGYSGLWYTWERGRHPSSRIRERLARFLDSQRWNAAFALAVVEHLWRMKSYHTPIMVCLLGSSRKHKRRKRPFKFETTWLLDDDCERRVVEVLKGCEGPSFSERISSVADELTLWSKKSLSNLSFLFC